jgi:hypothetical protein
MFLHLSAYLDTNLYRAAYSGLMHQQYQIQCGENMYVNKHIQSAKWQFGRLELRNIYLLGLAFRPEVASALQFSVCFSQVELHMFLCITIVSAYSLWCHLVKAAIQLCGLDQASQHIFLSQPLIVYNKETHHLASSHLRTWREVS